MATAKFRFISDAAGGDQFTVVSFSGREAISSLYRYQIELKAPLSAAIDLDTILLDQVRFESEIDGQVSPVHGVLASFDEMQTVQGEVYYRAELVPKLWRLSTYVTNEIYTTEMTVDAIIEQVLSNANFPASYYDLAGLVTSSFLRRGYVCQFGESDFDFISRLMENEGIFYYFEQSNADSEKMILVNDLNYDHIPRPGLHYDVAAKSQLQHDCISAWSCRKQSLPSNVTVRDFNPSLPSHDIADTMPIDQHGQGTEYLYGCHIKEPNEATYLAGIRAEEHACRKTRFYGESGVVRLQPGRLFGLQGHPNSNYNNVEYLALEVNHEGEHLDMRRSHDDQEKSRHGPEYRNSFVAIIADEQYRPPQKTPKPRFYGTMTAFVHAEAASGVAAEVDDQGRYRVHLPFDRADGTKDSNDPDRKASAWIRMAQPYVGEDEGTYFPLKGGTEVLLTFINGDPDQPIISGALPNATTPSLLNHDNAHVATVKTSGGIANVSGAGSYTNRGIRVMDAANRASASMTEAQLLEKFRGEGASELVYGNHNGHFMPPSYFKPALSSNVNDFPFVWQNDFGQAKDIPDFIGDGDTEEPATDNAHIDRGTGPQYVHRVGSTFAYPQQERVYFCGTFHEDFHMDDVGVIGKKRQRNSEWLMTQNFEAKLKPYYNDYGWLEGDPQGDKPEIFHFPEPGGNAYQFDSNGDLLTDGTLEDRFPPNRKRGVSEDKRWGDQMTYAWGRVFNWSAGPEMGDGGAQGVFNYGNGYTENLLTETGGTSRDSEFRFKNHKGQWDFTKEGTPNVPINEAGTFVPFVVGITGLAKHVVSAARYLTQDDLTLTWELDPGATAAEKTFGHTYSYHMGLAVDIHEGNSISKTWGHSTETTIGNAESYTGGDSLSATLGTTSDWFAGTKFEMNLAATTATTIGVVNENFVGGKIEFELSASTGLSSTSDSRASAKKDDLYAIYSESSLEMQQNILKCDENIVNLNIMALKYSLMATSVNIQTIASVNITALGPCTIKSTTFNSIG